jgi:hypothetical protein
MSRTVKIEMPLLKKKSNVIDLVVGETEISFMPINASLEEMKIFLFNSESRHLKQYITVGYELPKLKLNVANFNSFWIERNGNGFKYEIQAAIR